MRGVGKPGALTVRGLTKRFAGVTALAEVDLEVRAGEILAVVGPNGSGKTTLFNVISGFYRPTTGTVVFDGVPLTGKKPDRINQLGLARTFQQAMAFTTGTVRENLEIAQLAHTDDPGWRAELIALCGLTEVAETMCAGLPYGLQRKLGVALGLATRPRLMLLDEPAAGLSDTDADDLAALITSLPQQGVSVACIDHNLPFLLPIADRVVVLDAGRKIFDGAPEEARGSAAVVEAYLGESDA
ncbi:ABC transporter ATP-binding protein [Rhizomonospora bruguierae]|uniref:ABC transporter ATP-binding protein n=1 Tax=Rhizomonospora bruguierae TaxID=1581705 RepID=UPI001BCB2871|nr:ABC transporter ATP-binding protein [Micromonospora sp. NBRC 107566]